MNCFDYFHSVDFYSGLRTKRNDRVGFEPPICSNEKILDKFIFYVIIYNMGIQAEDNREETVDDVKIKKSYNKKLSVGLYKRFTLLTFAVYYIHCMIRIVMRCIVHFNSKQFENFAQWWEFVISLSSWKEAIHEIFDWYTLTLIAFLFLYALVFMFTFIRFSPKNKKTFKVFKKGFLMARRVIKIINLALSITVLINSAQLLTFVDKFMFAVSLCSLIFTFLQICASIAVWIVSRRINKNYSSVKAYVGKMGNVMNSYVITARLRNSENREDGSKTFGDKLGDFRSRFVHTVEALTFTEEEARASDLAFSEQYYIGEGEYETDKFENDYVPPESAVAADAESEEKNVKRKHSRHKSKSASKKTALTDRKSKTAEKKKTVKKTATAKKKTVKKTATAKKNTSEKDAGSRDKE